MNFTMNYTTTCVAMTTVLYLYVLLEYLDNNVILVDVPAVYIYDTSQIVGMG